MRKQKELMAALSDLGHLAGGGEGGGAFRMYSLAGFEPGFKIVGLVMDRASKGDTKNAQTWFARCSRWTCATLKAEVLESRL